MQYWIWLALKREISLARARVILEYFSTPQQVYYADREAYSRIDQIKRSEMEALCDKDLSAANRVLEQCYERNIRMVTLQDAQYPDKLKQIYDPPLVLYFKGKLPAIDARPSIGVIGTRDATDYGCMMAKRIGFQLSKGGAIVVSGAARGIDAMGMKGALSAGSPVIGVLGTGADVVYPLCNRELFEDTENFGCLLTEFVPGTPPSRGNFPRRNRLISGLSDGVVVVEAPVRSGSLITARQALDQGRDVFVVPKNVGSQNSAGSNGMIRSGAILIESGWDILQEYTTRYPEQISQYHGGTTVTLHPQERQEGVSAKTGEKAKSAPEAKQERIEIQPLLEQLPPTQAKILTTLERRPHLPDELAQICQIEAAELLAELTMLEIGGYIRRLPGNLLDLQVKN